MKVSFAMLVSMATGVTTLVHTEISRQLFDGSLSLHEHADYTFNSKLYHSQAASWSVCNVSRQSQMKT